MSTKPIPGDVIHVGVTPTPAMVTAVELDGTTIQATLFVPGSNPEPLPNSIPYSETPANGAWSWPKRETTTAMNTVLIFDAGTKLEITRR